MKYLIFLIIFFSSNNLSKSEHKEISIYYFFKNTDWQEFNKKTLLKNNLSYILDNNIDLFERESFFRFMSNFNKQQYYSRLYIIEILSKNGERATNKKIFLINYKGKISFIGFTKGIFWGNYNVTDKEKETFKSLNSNATKKLNTEQMYILISEVRGMKF